MLARRPERRKALRGRPAGWLLLKAPKNLNDKQATTLPRLKAAGGEVWRLVLRRRGAAINSSRTTTEEAASDRVDVGLPAQGWELGHEQPRLIDHLARDAEGVGDAEDLTGLHL